MNGDSLHIDASALYLGMSDINLIISNQCDTLFTDVSLIVNNCQIPNIITPNGDLNNDVFYTHYAEIYTDVTLIVYNRWGRKVFEKPITEMIGMVSKTMEVLYQMAPIFIF